MTTHQEAHDAIQEEINTLNHEQYKHLKKAQDIAFRIRALNEVLSLNKEREAEGAIPLMVPTKEQELELEQAWRKRGYAFDLKTAASPLIVVHDEVEES